MQVAEVVASKRKFRRQISSRTQFGDDHRTGETRAGTNRAPRIDRHRPLRAADDHACAACRQRFPRYTQKAFWNDRGPARLRAQPEVHHLDRGLWRRMAEPSTMGGVKMGDEARTESHFDFVR